MRITWRTLAAGLALSAAGCGGDRAAETPAPPPADTTAAAPAPAVPAFSTPAPDSAPPARAVGTVCPDPARPCPGFRSHDLSFVLPSDGVARAESESEEFFAVLLRSDAACAISEAQRAEAQAGFADRKVFAHRFGCDDDVENNVTYTGVNDQVAFLGVFAGRQRAEADSVLAAVQRGGAHPGANLRRMRVKLVYP